MQAETCNTCAHTFCINSAQASTSPSETTRRKPNVGAIAGGVIGGLIVIAVATYLIWRCCIKSRRQRYEEELRRQQAEEDEKWASEVEASEQARKSTLAPGSAVRGDERTSVHTVASSASSVFTRASNVIQIAYIPGVTNRSPPSTPGLLVPPVPPLPAATSPNSTVSPATTPNAADPDRHFFMPEIRDSTYSAATESTMQRESMAASLGRSSVATTIYRNNAIVNPVPAQTVIRGKAAVVSVKSSNQSSPNESRTPTPPMPVIDYERFGRARAMSGSQAGGDDNSINPRVPPSPAFSVGSTFLSGAANTAMVATPRPISVRKPSSKKSMRTSDGLPTLTPSVSSASKHSRARRPDLAARAGLLDDDDEEDDEPGARARKSMFGVQHQRDSARTVIEDTPVLSSAHRSPFSDTQAISPSPSSPLLSSGRVPDDHLNSTNTNTTTTSINTSPISPSSSSAPDPATTVSSVDSTGLGMSSGITPSHHHHSGSLSAVIEEAARRAARQPTHGGLGSSNNRDPSPFSDANAVRTP